MTKPSKRILILTVSGGGGHLQAAIAKEQELLSKGFKDIIKRDLFNDYLGDTIGSFCSGLWNYCQTHGKITTLYFFSFAIKFADPVFGIFQGAKFLYDLNHHHIDHVIDTQVLGTKILLKCIRLTNYLKDKQITYEKVFTDLPTASCTHFFHPLKKLSKKERKLCVIKTTKPLLQEGQSEEEFFKHHTNLHFDQVIYSNFPLRESFFSYERKEVNSIYLKTYSPLFTHRLCKCASFGSKEYLRKKNSLLYTFGEEKISLITLGAFPHKSAVMQYVKAFIKQKNKFCKDRKDVLFLLIGKEKSAINFCEKVIDYISNEKDYPKNLTIFPLPFQDDKTIAPIFFHLDFVIAKSGGLTTMELLTAPVKHIFLHNGKKSKLSKYLKYLIGKEIDTKPPWEKGNAEYLCKIKKAQEITPEQFWTKTESFFKQTLKNSSLTHAQ